MRTIPSISLLLVLLSAGPARAACDDLVRAAADQVQLGSGLASTTLRDLKAGCGDSGPARVVDALVDRGACDAAAQLGRSLSGYVGMDRSVARADECLGEQLRYGLDDLEVAAAEEAPAPARDVGAQERSRDAADEGGYGSLGTRGAGAGGGASVYGSSPAAQPGGPAARRESAQAEPDASSGDGRKYKGNVGASTGMGRYMPSPVDDGIASASPIAAGTDVAWSQLSFQVWFDFDSAALQPEALGTLATLAQHVRTMGDGTVLEVVGHTDSSGSSWYNEDLSIRRAGSVKDALALAGVASGTMVIRGMGENQPAYANDTEFGRARNRRVEFRFYKPVAPRQITK